jgi:hypothetical protein
MKKENGLSKTRVKEKGRLKKGNFSIILNRELGVRIFNPEERLESGRERTTLYIIIIRLCWKEISQ